ncbi:MAG: O-antigen ligase family protein [Chloroflexota bacterium]
MPIFFAKFLSPNRYTNWQSMVMASLCVLTCIIIASDFSIGSGILFLLLIATIGFVAITYLVPELPFIVLYMGMPIWVLIGRFAPIGDGQSTLLTTGWAFLCVIAHRFLFPKDSREKFKLDACDVVLGVFTAWIWLSLIWSPNNTYGYDKALGFTILTTAIYVFARFGLDTPRFSPKRLVYLVIVAGLGHACIVASAAFLWGLDSNARKNYFLKTVWDIGSVGGADALSFGLLATTALFMLTRQRYLKLLYALAFLFQLWAFSTYEQRGATIGLFVGILFIYFALSRTTQSSISGKSNVVPIVLGICLLPVLAYLLYWLNPQFRGEYLASDYSYLSRFMFLRIGISVFWQSPIIGTGIGGMGTAWRAGFDEFYVHNRYLEIIAELGIFGLILIIIFTVFLYRRLQIGLAKVESPSLRLGMVTAGAVLLQRYILGLSGGDLTGWRIGLWAALAVTIYTKFLENESESITDSSILRQKSLVPTLEQSTLENSEKGGQNFLGHL